MGSGSGRAGRMVPSAPLLVAIERERGKGTRSIEEIAKDCGVASTRIRSWRRLGTPAEIETADKVLTRLGLLWWECYDEDAFPEAHARAEEVFG